MYETLLSLCTSISISERSICSLYFVDDIDQMAGMNKKLRDFYQQTDSLNAYRMESGTGRSKVNGHWQWRADIYRNRAWFIRGNIRPVTLCEAWSPHS